MWKVLSQLWRDDAGAIIATEYLFVVTILVIGIVVGLSNLQVAITTELTELGNAILALSQGYSISGQMGNGAGTDGSQAIDFPQTMPGPVMVPPAIPSIISVPVPSN